MTSLLRLLPLGVLAGLLLAPPGARAVIAPPTLIVAGTNTFQASGPAVFIATNVLTNVTVTGSSMLDGANVLISNFNTGDILSWDATYATANGVAGSYDSTKGVLSFTGSASTAIYQNVLASVKFNNSQPVPAPADRIVLFSLGRALPNPANGHFYVFVGGVAVTWSAAKAAAATSNYYGLQGYLATVTSAQENAFLKEKMRADAWLGGTDDYAQINAATGANSFANQAASEGRYYWVTGPEAGTPISIGNRPSGPVAVGGAYMNWAGAQPDNFPSPDPAGEQYLQIYSSQGGTWNDLPNSFPFFTVNYVVEYGGMGGDPVLQIAGQVTVQFLLNQPPVANNDTYSVNEDATLTVVAAQGVLANDTDPDMNSLTAIKLSDPASGTVTFNANGSFTYVPAADFFGTASFTYKANDGTADSGIATASITVTAVNDAPVAVNDSYTVSQGDVLTVAAAGVLANDTDVENNPLTATKLTDPAQGPVTFSANGGFTYTPNTNFYGTDSFTYRANDGTDNSAAATVSLTVLARPTNAVPLLQRVFSSTRLRFSATNTPDANPIRVGDPDSTVLTVSLTVTNGTLTVTNLGTLAFVDGTTNGTNLIFTGTLAGLNAALESLSYRSTTNFFGDDTLVIVSTDEGGRTNRGNGTVPLLVEIPTLGGVPKVSLDSLNNPMTGRMITNVTALTLDTNLVQGITFDSVSNVVNVLPVGGQDGSTNRSTITVKVKFSDGTEQDVTIPVIIYQPLLAATTNEGAYNATFGAPIFNPQTSLYEQKVSVVNNTPFDFTALRITATNLPAGVTLRNASVTNGGLPYIEYNLAVLSGSNVTLTLEYYNANRAGIFTPGLKLELLNSSRVIPPPTNPVMTAVTARRGYAPDGRVRLYIEFPTVAGLTYYVQYRDAVGDPWKTSPVIIPGTGNRLNWLDEGAPNTDSPPTAARFYRIVTGN